MLARKFIYCKKISLVVLDNMKREQTVVSFRTEMQRAVTHFY